MAVGIPSPVKIPAVRGFRSASVACGIKESGTPDLLLVQMAPHTTVAGVFTRNQIKAAPVTLCQERLFGGIAQALLVNSGNANVGNGPRGMVDALTLSQAVAEQLHIPEHQIFLASTGIIGRPLPVERPLAALPGLAANLTPNHWQEAAQAIMTTDTFAKVTGRQFEIGGTRSALVGIAKGAGMIHPNMATMLSFLFTDVAITPTALQTLLHRAVEESFNAITVDGDTSTNDTVLLFASGMADNPVIHSPDEPRAAPLAEALSSLCQELAQAIVRDGEGASKLITITVNQARSRAEAKQVAMAVAKSSLTKTAFFGCDPNWGRILAAVGYAGVPLEVERIRITLGDLPIVTGGVRDPAYQETAGAAVMQQSEITVRIELGLGQEEQTIWTCDLSHEYIRINADYRT